MSAPADSDAASQLDPPDGQRSGQPSAMGPSQQPFRLRAGLDPAGLHEQFRARGHVHIPDVLDERDAARLYRSLSEHTRWNLVFKDGDKHYDLGPEQVAALRQEQWLQLQRIIHAQAGEGFQYLYNNYPIYDARRAGLDRGHLLHVFLEWLDGPVFLDFARAVTGHADIRYVDAQATRYGPGHFLCCHDDSAAGKNRRAAYVFGFTPRWRIDWGGLLQFVDERGHLRGGLSPTYNSLNLLAVPQMHNVSLVAPFAGAARLSITGWLRYGEPP